MLATFAQFERRLISQRTKDALAVKRAQGVRLGRPPVLEAELRDRIREMCAGGSSLARIADELTAGGVATGPLSKMPHLHGKRDGEPLNPLISRALASVHECPPKPSAAPAFFGVPPERSEMGRKLLRLNLPAELQPASVCGCCFRWSQSTPSVCLEVLIARGTARCRILLRARWSGRAIACDEAGFAVRSSKGVRHEHRCAPFPGRYHLFGLLVLVGLVLAAVAYAAIPDSSGKLYHACMLKNVGTIRIIDPSGLGAKNLLGHCTNAETEITWNQVGPKGDPGPAGPQGAKGDTGARGPQGEKGEPGAAGLRGEPGATGVQGAPGAAGASAFEFAVADGFSGTLTQWLTSLKGADGSDGATGAQGPQGEKGETGATGAEGPQGEKGEAGAQGPKGDPGLASLAALAGTACSRGETLPAGKLTVSTATDGTVTLKCEPAAGTIQMERCNGIDDDLDGRVDEDWPQLGMQNSWGGRYVCRADGSGVTIDGVPPNVDWANLQSPATMSYQLGTNNGETEAVYSRYYLVGVQGHLGCGQATWLAPEIGWGPVGTSPATSPSAWHWRPFAGCLDIEGSGQSEYHATMKPTAAGDYDYVFRYWAGDPNLIYAEKDGPHLPGVYDPAQAGHLTVVSG